MHMHMYMYVYVYMDLHCNMYMYIVAHLASQPVIELGSALPTRTPPRTCYVYVCIYI